MDIKTLKEIVAQDEEGVVVQVYQKTGEPYLGLDGEPSSFTVTGTEAEKYIKAKRAHQRKLFKMLRRLKGDQTIDPEVAKVLDIELLTAAVIGFGGWDDGKTDLPFTPENVKMLLEIDHIFEQVRAGVDSHADFFLRQSDN